MKIYKKMVSACIIITEADGEESFLVKEFSIFTEDLFRLKAWLLSMIVMLLPWKAPVFTGGPCIKKGN